MNLREALDASSPNGERAPEAWAIMEDGETIVTVDIVKLDATHGQYRLSRQGRQYGVPVTTWGLEHIQLLSHSGLWWPSRDDDADRCIF